MKKNLRVTGVMVLAVFCSARSSAPAQISDIYARQSMALRGEVEADVQLLAASGTMTIAETAAVRGDARLPEDPRHQGGEDPHRRVASTVKVVISSAPHVHEGQIREIASFELPVLSEPKPAKGKRDVRVQGGENLPDKFDDARSITIANALEPIPLPPGEYDELSVENSRLILGVVGALRPARYDFGSIELLRGALVDLAGPVIITAGSLTTIQGTFGRADLPGWLDLRIAGRAILVPAGGAIYGSVYAPNSALTLADGAVAVGWLAGSEVTIDPKGRFKAQKIDWDSSAHPSGQPVFPQRAVIIQNRLPGFSARIAGHFTAGATYEDDLPTLVLTEVSQRNMERREAKDMAIFFDAFRTLLANSFAEEARVIMRLGPGANRSAASIDVRMTRSDFEGHLWAIGRKELPAESIRRIEESTLLQNLFMVRSQKVAAQAIERAR